MDKQEKIKNIGCRHYVKIIQIITTKNRLKCDIENNDDDRIYGLGEDGLVYEYAPTNKCWHLDHRKAVLEAKEKGEIL